MGNLLEHLRRGAPAEALVALVEAGDVRIERIVSDGHATPAGEWYDQETDEWVMVVRGSAGLRFEEEPTARVLREGDWVHIPAHARHRVEWTDGREPTVWLAVHWRATPIS
jgi:cupin 2 domain-containing protein